jgi:peptide/nickel transport system substrate-binding protein
LITRLAALGGVTAFPGLLTACGGDDDSSTTDGVDGSAPATAGTGDDQRPTVGRRLVAGLPGSISTLDVTREAGILNYVVSLLTLESLLAIDDDGALVPGLASAWSQPDPLTYVFDLRDGVEFSDGSPLTVDDVIASLEVNTAEGSTSVLAYAYTGISSVEQTGDRQLTITLAEPNAAFAWTLSPGSFQITSRAFLETHGEQVGTPDVGLLGTGPYVITEFSPDSHVELAANPNWWGGEVELTELRLDFIAEESTRQLAMREGDIQLAMNVGVDQISQWEQIDGVQVATTTDNSLVALAFNTTIAPFDDIRVRKAVGHCIDRTAIVDSLLDGNGLAAVTLPSPEQWGGILDDDEVTDLYARIPTVEFDIDQAAAELAASSVPDGFSVSVTYPNSGPQIGTALLSLADNLGKIGVDLTVNEITLEQWIAELGEHTSPMLALWYFATTGDPAEYTHILLHSSYTGPGGTNVAGYDNAEVTDLLDRAQSSTDPAERGRLLGDALVAAAADVPYVPLWWGAAATAFTDEVAPESYGPYFFIGPWAASISA